MPDRNQPMTLSETVQSREMRRQRSPATSERHWSEWFALPGRLALLTAVLASPWMFGAVYSFAQGYLAIALMVAAACWYLESAFSPRSNQVVPYLLWFVVLGVLLALAQTQTIWPRLSTLLGQLQMELFAASFADGAIAQDQLVPTITLDAEATWRYTRLLIVGCAGLLLGARLFRRPFDVAVLLVAMTANGVALAFFGMIQRFSHNGKMYWTYESDYSGTLFGPFVNRNNAAGFLLICLAAAIGLIVKVWSQRVNQGPELLVSKEIPIWRQIATYWQIALSELTATKMASILAAVFIAVGVIATLSRGGVLALLVGAMATLLFYGMARKPRAGGLLLLPLVGLVILLASWIGFYDQLLGRFSQLDTSAELASWDGRIVSWQTTIPRTFDFGWLGAGLGSYPIVHRLFADFQEIHRFDYAENQFVQTLVELGVPGLLLLIGAVWMFLALTLFLLNRASSPHNVAVGTAGVFLISAQVVAGSFDFGWYIPANLLNFAVLAGVICFHGHSLAGRLKKKTWWARETYGWIIKPAGLVLVASLVILVVDYRREVEWDQMLRRLPGNKPRMSLERETCSLEQAREAIAELEAAAGSRPIDSQVANRLGDLWVHCAQWELFNQLRQNLPTESLQGEAAERVAENLWNLTSLIRLHEQVSYLQNTTGASGVREFRLNAPVRENLPPAASYFAQSIRRRPYQAETHMKLGRLALILLDNSRGLDQIEHAVRLAPGNVNLRYMAALAEVFSNRYELAFEHLRKLLILEPKQFVRTVRLLQGLTGRLSKPVDNRLIADSIIPNEPEMIYDFLSKHLPESEDSLRRELLDRAIALVSQRTENLIKNRGLMAELYLAKGAIDQTIEAWEWVVVASPNDYQTRERLTALLIAEQRFDEAESHAQRLLSSDSRNKRYIQLMKQVDDGQRQQREQRKPTPPSGDPDSDSSDLNRDGASDVSQSNSEFVRCRCGWFDFRPGESVGLNASDSLEKLATAEQRRWAARKSQENISSLVYSWLTLC